MDLLNDQSFKFALENTVDAVLITDMDSIIQYINPAFSRITGYSPEDVLGKKPSVIKSPHTTLETYQKMWSVITGGGWWRGEILNRKKSGELWHSFLSISQIRDVQGNPFAYIGISRDITEMKQLEQKLFDMSLEAIYMLSMAAEAKDNVTGSHLQRVRYYSEAIARQLGLPEEQVVEIGYSSMMHDVGKLNIPDEILKKAGKLTPQEWVEMKKHPVKGAAILRDQPFYEVAREIAMGHHERWDGAGYPDGKRGEQIPLSARITTIADVFDALTSSRSYKDAWPESVARAKIVEGKGSLFDPRAVDAFEHVYKAGIISEIRRRYPLE